MRIAVDLAFDDWEERKSSGSARLASVPEAKFVAQLVACHAARHYKACARKTKAGADAYLASPHPSAERPQWISKIV